MFLGRSEYGASNFASSLGKSDSVHISGFVIGWSLSNL